MDSRGNENRVLESKDVLDSCLTLEEEHYQEGFEDGYRDGRMLGRDEGRVMGLQKGFEIGYEIGMYAGHVLVWRRMDIRSAKVSRLVESLHAMLEEFPLGSPHDETLQDKMDAIRSKYTTIMRASKSSVETKKEHRDDLSF
ncbi:hypothetical protein M9435_002066 [Picochlorum sp. BPE23]|nr:hypothetical protein M9435_002066 [Picochlorum sp. BPE23]